MSVTLREHQKTDSDVCFLKLAQHRKVFFQAATGYGKGIVIAWVAKYSNLKPVIACHRMELVDQLIESLSLLGMTTESITQKTKKLHHKADCYVGMIDSIYNRLQKNPDYLKNVGILICDEAHRGEFRKLYDFWPDVKVVGFSATPILMERETYFKCNLCSREYLNKGEECCGNLMEWSRPLAMSRFFDDIVVGAGIDYLISKSFLVEDFCIYSDFDDSKLEVNDKGEFSEDSLDEVFGSESARFNVIQHFEEYCKGKKTIIFNSSTKASKTLYDEFIEKGYTNVRMFDSVYKEESGSLEECLAWFKSTPDAVLLNVDKFTTGMDVTDIQSVILNRATLSLSLYLQMVGRGGRSTKLIYKDMFILIDLGGNIKRHLRWSDGSRDWEGIFFKGVGPDKPKKQRLDDISDCENCGMLKSRGSKICPTCGFEEITPPPLPLDPVQRSEILLKPIREIPPPSGEKIYLYVKSVDKNINYALNTVLVNRILDMFTMYRVSKGQYLKSLENGKLDESILRMTQDCYYYLARKRDIIPENWGKKKISTLVEKVKSKLEKRYCD